MLGVERGDRAPDPGAVLQHGAGWPAAGTDRRIGLPVGCRGTGLKNLGRIGIGLGLMLMALAGLQHTLGPIENTPLLRPVVSALAHDPLLAVVGAAALTWACHSSIAIVLLVSSFAATHVVDPAGALALVLGANLGGHTATAG